METITINEKTWHDIGTYFSHVDSGGRFDYVSNNLFRTIETGFQKNKEKIFEMHELTYDLDFPNSHLYRDFFKNEEDSTLTLNDLRGLLEELEILWIKKEKIPQWAKTVSLHFFLKGAEESPYLQVYSANIIRHAAGHMQFFEPNQDLISEDNYPAYVFDGGCYMILPKKFF